MSPRLPGVAMERSLSSGRDLRMAARNLGNSSISPVFSELGICL